MKKNIIKTLFLSVLTALTGCSDYLDPIPTDRYSDKVVWQSEANADLYLNGFYTYINTYGNFGTGQFGGLLTDGMTDMLKYGSSVVGAGTPNEYAYEPTKITPDQNSLGIWADAYNRIRRVNEFIVGLKEYAPFPESVKNRYEAQARFFRAFLYHQLVIRHGTAILFDAPNTKKDNPLSPESACWDFIESDLDFASQHLPKIWDNANAGRLTKGAAFAFKSRSMLFAKRWDKAKIAADSVFALNIYELASEYKNAFKSYSKSGNKESILEFNYLAPSPVHGFDAEYAPGGDWAEMGGKATPTQEMVEEYELATGGKPNWNDWHAASGTDETPPYAELEPRFHASILYNGANWKGRKIQTYIGGIDGYMQFGDDAYPKGKTTTGYYLKKWIDESNTDLANQKSSQAWIEIRLAEVYLNHAEACAMLGENGPANNDLTIVRGRAGLNHATKSGNELMEAIRHERKIELAFEGKYYWDLRRWRLAHTVLNNVRYHAMRIESTNGQLVYKYVECDNKDRKFLERLYAFPIPSSEIANNLAITQINPW
jgi:hypothetical protein